MWASYFLFTSFVKRQILGPKHVFIFFLMENDTKTAI